MRPKDVTWHDDDAKKPQSDEGTLFELKKRKLMLERRLIEISGSGNSKERRELKIMKVEIDLELLELREKQRKNTKAKGFLARVYGEKESDN